MNVIKKLRGKWEKHSTLLTGSLMKREVKISWCGRLERKCCALAEGEEYISPGAKHRTIVFHDSNPPACTDCEYLCLPRGACGTL